MTTKAVTPKELHSRAMELAGLAYIARRQGQWQEAVEYAAQALEIEAQAARALPKGPESEPTRSILFLGAASLAYQAGKYQKALALITEGISPHTPEDTLWDLENLRQDVRFAQYLQELGLELSPEEAHVILSGPAIGYGAIPYKEFSRRLEALIDLVKRTAERLSLRQYRKGGKARFPFETIIATAPPGSFGFKLRLAIPPETQPLIWVEGKSIIEEITQGLDLVAQGRVEELRARFAKNLPPEQAEAYLRNFLAGAKRLTPDGKRVETIGIATSQRQVTLTPEKSQLLRDLLETLTQASEEQGKPIVVTGELDRADKRSGKIRITEEETQKEYHVRVQEGLEDLVRSYFGEKVTVKGTLQGKTIHLHDIEPADT